MAKEKKTGGGFRWRLWLGLLAGGAACVSTAMAAIRVHRYVTTDPLFTLSRERRGAIEYYGLVYTNRSKVQFIFAGDYEHNVFAIPVAERRRRLLAVDWIEDASVSRLLPDRLVVHVRERVPAAFVSFRSGVFLIDRNGVLLEPPPRVRFNFPVLTGVTEEQSEADRAKRVRQMQRVMEEIGPAGKDISEVNLSDPENVRLVTQPAGHAAELTLGDGNFGRRYQTYLTHHAEIERRSPGVKQFDLRLDDRILAKE
jgi:cell division protein FtsQ